MQKFGCMLMLTLHEQLLCLDKQGKWPCCPGSRLSCRIAVTVLKFLSATAGTGIVAANSSAHRISDA